MRKQIGVELIKLSCLAEALFARPEDRLNSAMQSHNVTKQPSRRTLGMNRRETNSILSQDADSVVADVCSTDPASEALRIVLCGNLIEIVRVARRVCFRAE